MTDTAHRLPDPEETARLMAEARRLRGRAMVDGLAALLRAARRLFGAAAPRQAPRVEIMRL
mgnify:FL=1